MHKTNDDEIKTINREDLITRYTVSSLIYDQQSASFSYNFPIAEVFETTEETMQAIEDKLKFKANVWHTVCPLYLPKELEEEKDLAQCLHVDSAIKEAIYQAENKEEQVSATIISIFDVYNDEVYPDDIEAKKYIDYDFPVLNYTGDSVYLNLLEEMLPPAIKRSKPDFIIYNAGNDVFKGDLLGKMSLSKEGIIKRDEMVFQYAREKKIPVLMLLSGGYSKKSAEISSESIANILEKFFFTE